MRKKNFQHIFKKCTNDKKKQQNLINFYKQTKQQTKRKPAGKRLLGIWARMLPMTNQKDIKIR